MPRPQLRIYPASRNSILPPANQRVTVRLKEICALLIDAVETDRTWLDDFEEEELDISTDLYDCICAYQHWRPSA